MLKFFSRAPIFRENPGYFTDSGVKLATSGLLDLDDLAEKSISELGEKIASEQISKYESSKKTIQSFRKQLATFAKDISRVDENNKHFPLIILIDELDRCRPTYAIEILEKAKHFFNVENIIFVLSMDKEQIGHSIQSVYGIGMNVDGYLRRFIDLDYFLPPPSKGKFCKALFRRFGLDEYFQKRTKSEFINDKDQFLGVFSELFSIFDFSLRVQEQCFSLLSVALKTTPENSYLYPILLGALISLKAENSQIYKAFITRKATAQDVLEYIQKKPKGDELGFTVCSKAHRRYAAPGARLRVAAKSGVCLHNCTMFFDLFYAENPLGERDFQIF